MPEISPPQMAYSEGSAIGGPVVGALVPFVLGPITNANAAAQAAGAFTMGFYAPCDMMLQSVAWSAHTYSTGTNTIAIYKHTDVAGGEGGTAILAATSINAFGRVEGDALGTKANRQITKGQAVVVDPVLSGTGEFENLVIVIMAVIGGHAVADKAARGA